MMKHSNTHTHTHPFNGSLSGATRVSQYQKGKNQSGFYWSKRQWVAVSSAGPYASLHLAPDRYHTSTPPLSFLQARCPSCHPTNSVKALKAKMKHSNTDPKQNVGAHGFAVSYNRLVLILAIPAVQFNTPAQTRTHNIACPLRMCNSSSFAFFKRDLKTSYLFRASDPPSHFPL